MKTQTVRLFALAIIASIILHVSLVSSTPSGLLIQNNVKGDGKGGEMGDPNPKEDPKNAGEKGGVQGRVYSFFHNWFVCIGILIVGGVLIGVGGASLVKALKA